MRGTARVIVLLCGSCFMCRAELTPLEKLPAGDGEMVVECEYKGGDEAISGVVPTPGTYHYRLYLPRDYHERPDARYPCLFISSPAAEAQMGQMADRLKRDRNMETI